MNNLNIPVLLHLRSIVAPSSNKCCNYGNHTGNASYCTDDSTDKGTATVDDCSVRLLCSTSWSYTVEQVTKTIAVWKSTCICAFVCMFELRYIFGATSLCTYHWYYSKLLETIYTI